MPFLLVATLTASVALSTTGSSRGGLLSAAQIEQFERDGFIVVPGVLNEAECEAQIDEVWASLEPSGTFRHDPASWDRWPDQGGVNLGIFGTRPFVGRRSFANRQHPRVYDVFRELMRHDELWVTIDRLGVLRPTIDKSTGAERGAPHRRRVISLVAPTLCAAIGRRAIRALCRGLDGVAQPSGARRSSCTGISTHSGRLSTRAGRASQTTPCATFIKRGRTR
jgi:hypothetical protein